MSISTFTTPTWTTIRRCPGSKVAQWMTTATRHRHLNKSDAPPATLITATCPSDSNSSFSKAKMFLPKHVEANPSLARSRSATLFSRRPYRSSNLNNWKMTWVITWIFQSRIALITQRCQTTDRNKSWIWYKRSTLVSQTPWIYSQLLIYRSSKNYAL